MSKRRLFVITHRLMSGPLKWRGFHLPYRLPGSSHHWRWTLGFWTLCYNGVD